MKFQFAASLFFFTQLFSVFAAASELNKRDDNDENVRYITSDGVVYRYAVKTSTIAPASVVLHTRYYTTTIVREITLDNNQVTTTTEAITSASISSQSISASNSNAVTSSSISSSESIQTPSSSPSSLNQNDHSSFSSYISSISSTSIEPSQNIDHSQSSEPSQPVKSLTPESENEFLEQHNSSSSIKESHVESSSTIRTSTYSESPRSSSVHYSSSVPSSEIVTTSSSSPTSSTVPSSSSFDFENKSYSISKSDGTCYVYYDDDEYYSTVYLTESGQSVDAASTITSTRTVFKTVTTQS